MRDQAPDSIGNTHSVFQGIGPDAFQNLRVNRNLHNNLAGRFRPAWSAGFRGVVCVFHA